MVVSLSMLTVVCAVGLPPDKESEECWTEFLHDMCGAPSRPEGCTNSAPSCYRLIVFVQQPTKSISPTHACAIETRCLLELFLLGCLKLQGAERSLSVVVINVDPEDVLVEAEVPRLLAETPVHHQPILCPRSDDHGMSNLNRTTTKPWWGRLDSNQRPTDYEITAA
jgi:hypothetical protein